MAEKDVGGRKYHFRPLPYPEKMTIADADTSLVRINYLHSELRKELSKFDDGKAYNLYGYSTMTQLIKSTIEEISPRYAHGLLDATKIEKSMELNGVLGTVPYYALMLLKPFSVRMRKKLWLKSADEMLTGDSRVNALKRVIRLYKLNIKPG